MEWSDVGLILLIAAAVWFVLIEPRTPYRFEDGVRLAAGAVRAAARRVAPFVRWLAYDVIVGRTRDDITSSSASVPITGENLREPHSAAVEQGGNEAGTLARNIVPGSLVGRMNDLPDSELFGALALLTDPSGAWRFADSRLARFAGGRVSDRLDEIRALRNEAGPATEPPPPAGMHITPYAHRRTRAKYR